MDNQTIIKTVHEETYSDGRTLGVLQNYKTFEDSIILRKINSFVYYFRITEDGGIYVIFETIAHMNDFMLYGDGKVKRAYMKEEVFDNFYDNGVEGDFEDHLKWLK